MEKETITLNNGQWRIIKMTLTNFRNMQLPIKTQLKIITLQKMVNQLLEPFEDVIKPLYDKHAEKELNGMIKNQNGLVVWKSAEDEVAFASQYKVAADQEVSTEIEIAKKIPLDELDAITMTGDALELFMLFIQK